LQRTGGIAEAARVTVFSGSATAYDRFMGRYSGPLARAFLDFAALAPGTRALDVGCGPGALTAELVSRLGLERVAAVEPSESFAAACRERTGVDVIVAPAETIPHPDGSFDATLAQLVVNFLADAPGGVREMARVVGDGGTVAACVWDYGDGMAMLRAFWDAAREVAPDLGASRDEGSVMRYRREGELAELWAEVGLAEIQAAPLEVSASYEDFDDLWQPFTAGIGPAGAFTASLDEAGQARLREALRARVGDPGGPFELSARAWAVSGTAG
jgi:SAM-dependent methyltransferase